MSSDKKPHSVKGWLIRIVHWSVIVLCLVYAFWLPERTWRERLADWRATPRQGSLPAVLSFLLVMGIGAYFRFAYLAQVPGEMNSDHAEKILDVMRVLMGQTNIFFPNNGGREADASQRHTAVNHIRKFITRLTTMRPNVHGGNYRGLLQSFSNAGDGVHKSLVGVRRGHRSRDRFSIHGVEAN